MQPTGHAPIVAQSFTLWADLCRSSLGSLGRLGVRAPKRRGVAGSEGGSARSRVWRGMATFDATVWLQHVLSLSLHGAPAAILHVRVWQQKTRALVQRYGGYGGYDVRPVFHPQTLSSGAESGLVNQIFALVGCAILAHLTNATLVLPDFASHDHGGSALPFTSLFVEDSLVAALQPILVAISRSEYHRLRLASDATRRRYRRRKIDNTSAATADAVLSVYQGDDLVGWHIFKGFNRLLATRVSKTAMNETGQVYARSGSARSDDGPVS